MSLNIENGWVFFPACMILTGIIGSGHLLVVIST